MQNRLFPEAADFGFVLGPVGHMCGKDRTERRVSADEPVKAVHHSVDVVWRDGKARGDLGHGVALVWVKLCSAQWGLGTRGQIVAGDGGYGRWRKSGL